MFMKIRHFFLCFALTLFFLTGCQTTSGLVATGSLKELEGHWCASDGSVEIIYPFVVENVDYLAFAFPQKDVTENWIRKARENGMTLSEIWNRRFCYMDLFPQADRNGTQHGERLFKNDFQTVSSREYYLVDQSVALNNLDCFAFERGRKGNVLHMTGSFRLFSTKFHDLNVQGKFLKREK